MATRYLRSDSAHVTLGSSALALIASAGLTMPVSIATAQQQGQPAWTGDMGITESVAQIMARAPVGRPNGIIESDEREDPDRSHLLNDPNSPAVSQWPSKPLANGKQGRSRLPTFPLLNPVGGGVTDNPQTLGTNVTTLNTAAGDSGYVPPDTQCSVGPTQIVVCANGHIRTYNKSGAADGALNTTFDSFFSSVRGSSSMSDQQVRYDRTSGRWFVLGINVANTSNRFCIAVSSGSTITNMSSFTFFFFQQDLVAPTGNSGQFADYPSLGVDANALYTGANMFSNTLGFVGTTGWVVQKSSVLGAGPIAATAFRGIGVAGGNGVYSPRGVDNDDPAATEGYFIGADVTAMGRLVMRRVSNPGGAPTISTNINITVPTTATPLGSTVSGSATPLDALDDRLFAATIHRDRTTGNRTLMTAHDIRATSSGVGSSSGDRNAARWYQLGNLTTTPTLIQSGTLYDTAASTPTFYFIPSAAMSGQGHIAVGCTQSSASTFAGTATAGRLNTDTLGSTQAPTTVVTGAAAYTMGSSNGKLRWGDYSATVVDPVDDQTIWTCQEFVNSGNSWALRLTKLIAPPPATPSSASPFVTAGDSNDSVTVTGVSTNGSQFYDTEPGYNRMTASVSGGGDVTVNSVTWNSPTQVTLNLSISPVATPGSRTITITNPDGQSSTSATGILTVNGGGPVCPSFTQQPSGTTVCRNGPVTLTAAATGNPAPTYQWQLNTVDIAGATSATYQLAAASLANSGVYTCTATNSCGSLVSNPATVNVLGNPPITQQPHDETVAPGSPASFTVAATGATSYQWYQDGSQVIGATDATYSIASVTIYDAGVYTCTITSDCGVSNSNGATLTVGTASTCYANCDQSTAIPFLNVADFTCFLQAYANGDPYANCDQSTTPPVLNVADFTCFLQAYAAGCSAP
jgi:hypothetical protein